MLVRARGVGRTAGPLNFKSSPDHTAYSSSSSRTSARCCAYRTSLTFAACRLTGSIRHPSTGRWHAPYVTESKPVTSNLGTLFRRSPHLLQTMGSHVRLHDARWRCSAPKVG